MLYCIYLHIFTTPEYYCICTEAHDCERSPENPVSLFRFSTGMPNIQHVNGGRSAFLTKIVSISV